MSVTVLYEDSDLIVCVKPAGVPSQSDPSGSTDMTALLREHLALRGEKSDVFVVHRLDRAVGGVMVYAKSKRAASELSRAIAERSDFEKIYLAVVQGEPQQPCGTLEDYIYKDAKAHKAYVASGKRQGVKYASLDYTLMDTVTVGEKKFSLLKIKLGTGRFHQIRVQLASRGLSICGDGKYGSREKCPSISLWAYSLSFTYNGRSMTFNHSPEENDLWNLFNTLI